MAVIKSGMGQKDGDFRDAVPLQQPLLSVI